MPRTVKRGQANVLVSPAIVDQLLTVLADEGRTFANYATRAVERQIRQDYERLRQSGEVKETAEVAAPE